MADKDKRIPAQYIGQMPLILQPGQGTGYNADGTKRETRTIEQGDILLIPEREISGFTLLHEGEQPLDLGVGKVVKTEHKDCDDRELAQLGYVFHQGRPDFIAVTIPYPIATETPPDDTTSAAKTTGKKGGSVQ